MLPFTPQLLVPRRKPIIAAGGADITTGLKSYWLMNDGSGSTVVDSISGHNGTLSNSGLWSGDFVNFSGGGYYGQAADHADFNVGGTFTVFGWVNGAALSGAIIFSQYDSGATQRSWLAGSDSGTGNKLRAVLSDNGSFSAGHNKDYTGSITLLDSTWHSWAIRFNAGTLDLFVDGFKDPSLTKSTDDAITTVFNSTADIAFNDIFSSGSTVGAGINGSQKKIRFYNIVKTDADIAAMHAVGA